MIWILTNLNKIMNKKPIFDGLVWQIKKYLIFARYIGIIVKDHFNY